jgi:Sulfotransferase family
VNLSRTDYLLLRAAQSGAGLFRSLGDVESSILRRRLNAIPIESPVFLCGLARSGTTILLQELSRVPGVGTHRYRDFPFLMIPSLWNRFLDWARVQKPSTERPHLDRIRVTAESPEAFEEPLWQFFLPHLHAADALHRLTGERRFDEFEAFFKDHIRKILLTRGQQRYLSKGNYNVVRIEYLATVFPDARFIIPIRHPFTQVRSLVRQHSLFTEYARKDPRVPRYLAAAGHYEFGPQRVPIRLSHEAGDRIRDAWQRGHDAAGYAIQWAEIYRFVDRLRCDTIGLAERILVVRYEDFCARPYETVQQILRHAKLGAGATIHPQAFEHIAAPETPDQSDLADDFRQTVWRETGAVAQRFGYASAECTPSNATRVGQFADGTARLDPNRHRAPPPSTAAHLASRRAAVHASSNG